MEEDLQGKRRMPALKSRLSLGSSAGGGADSLHSLKVVPPHTHSRLRVVLTPHQTEACTASTALDFRSSSESSSFTWYSLKKLRARARAQGLGWIKAISSRIPGVGASVGCTGGLLHKGRWGA